MILLDVFQAFQNIQEIELVLQNLLDKTDKNNVHMYVDTQSMYHSNIT